MADLTLADYLQSPSATADRSWENRLARGKVVMPEAYDLPEPIGTKMLQAAGAGAVSPFGVSEHALRALSNALADYPSIKARELADRLYEARQAYPGIAGAASGAVIGGLGGPVLGATLGEAAQIMPAAGVVGGGIGNLGDLLLPAKTSPRPQAAYPPGGAY